MLVLFVIFEAVCAVIIWSLRKYTLVLMIISFASAFVLFVHWDNSLVNQAWLYITTYKPMEGLKAYEFIAMCVNIACSMTFVFDRPKFSAPKGRKS